MAYQHWPVDPQVRELWSGTPTSNHVRPDRVEEAGLGAGVGAFVQMWRAEFRKEAPGNPHTAVT